MFSPSIFNLFNFPHGIHRHLKLTSSDERAVCLHSICTPWHCLYHIHILLCDTLSQYSNFPSSCSYWPHAKPTILTSKAEQIITVRRAVEEMVLGCVWEGWGTLLSYHIVHNMTIITIGDRQQGESRPGHGHEHEVRMEVKQVGRQAANQNWQFVCQKCSMLTLKSHSTVTHTCTHTHCTHTE